MSEPLSETQGINTPPRQVRSRLAFSPRRRRKRTYDSASPIQKRAHHATQTELARQEFVNFDHEWRTFLMDRESERNSLREIELQQQQKWQQLFEQMLQILNNVMDLFKNK